MLPELFIYLFYDPVYKRHHFHYVLVGWLFKVYYRPLSIELGGIANSCIVELTAGTYEANVERSCSSVC